MSSAKGKILIIGGGIGGLALAHGLKNHNIPFHVYERDRTESYRAQGYRVRIGGPATPALRSLLGEDVFADFELSSADLNQFPIPEIDAESGHVEEPKLIEHPVRAAVVDQDVGTNNSQPDSYCVDRSTFRDVLLKSLPATTISYDKNFSHYVEFPDRIVAHFRDGTIAEGTLLVGADGKGSNVRNQLLPNLNIQDTGARCVYGKTPITPQLEASLEPTVLQRMSFVKDRSWKQVLAVALEPIKFSGRDEMEPRGYTFPEDYLFWVIVSTPSRLGFDSSSHQRLSPEESEKCALALSEQWHPSIRAIIEHQQQGETSAFAISSVSKEFADKPWLPNDKITLLGDAVHPMAPTGNGAVMAITDALALCQVVESNSPIGSYEESIRSAAAKVIPTSWKAVQMMVGMTLENEVHIGEMAMQIRQNNSNRK